MSTSCPNDGDSSSCAGPMRTIEGLGLTLEPQTVAHTIAIFVVLSDPAIYAYENQPPPSAEWLLARFARLEARRSPDGGEQWLNWVIRLPIGVRTLSAVL